MRQLSTVLLALSLALATGCVHRLAVPQGNFLEEDAIDQLAPGMTREQVRFLLGTPMVADIFHQDRWDYVYYLKLPKTKELGTKRVSVYFDGDVVDRIERSEPDA